MSDLLNRILLATDGFEDATLAARAAVELSNRTGAELHVAHAWKESPHSAYPAFPSDYHLTYEKEARGLLERVVEWIRTFGGTVARAHLRRGRPAEEIAGLAEELGVDLVVLGNRGLGTVKRLVTGSVSEGVAHLAPCPTLTMRGGESAWPPSRLVVGDDSSPEAARAGELAAGIGKRFGARTLLVWAYPMTMFRARRASHVRMSEELLKRGEESLKERPAELEGILGTRPETKVVRGDAAAAILETAEEGGEPTLVAVGSRGWESCDASRWAASPPMSSGPSEGRS